MHLRLGVLRADISISKMNIYALTDVAFKWNCETRQRPGRRALRPTQLHGQIADMWPRGLLWTKVLTHMLHEVVNAHIYIFGRNNITSVEK